MRGAISHRLEPRRSTAAASLLLGILALVGLLAATRPTASQAAGSPGKPTIVLVNGAWANSASWSSVVGRLQHDGYRVDAPPNPLRSLAGDSEAIADYLSTISGAVVLVGHSYGGAVITDAATGNPNVKALVYINAFAPAQGESVLQLANARPGSALAGDPSTVFNAVPYPGAPTGDVDLYVKPGLFPRAFANDLSPKMGRILAATQSPVTLSALAAPSGVPAWKTIPSWYLVGSIDHVLPPAEQRFMARRAHAQIKTVRASHLSMISHPGAVTRLILDAVHSVS